MTPLERARRAVEGWDYWWSHSHNSNVLLMNIKREIEEAERSAYEQAAAICEEWDECMMADRIRKLKGEG